MRRSDTQMVIDSHVHLRGELIPASEYASWCNQYSDALGCPYKVALIPFCEKWSYYPDEREVRHGHEILMRYLEAYPDLFYGWTYVNPSDPDCALAEIERWVANGPLLGIKLWVAKKCSDPIVLPILQRAAELQAPILQHAWDKSVGQLADESLSLDLVQAAHAVPGCSFIMAHLGGFWQRALKTVAPYRNISVDCSGGWAHAGAIEKAVKLLGSDRVLYGSDAPLRDIPTQMAKVFGATITASDKQKILSRNFLRLTANSGRFSTDANH